MLFYSCRMFVAVKDFRWHASQCFCHFTPCIPIQVARVTSIPQMLPLPLIIGRLKNEVVEEKQFFAHGLGRWMRVTMWSYLQGVVFFLNALMIAGLGHICFIMD